MTATESIRHAEEIVCKAIGESRLVHETIADALLALDSQKPVFTLAQDCEGNWYVIPEDRHDDFSRWVNWEGELSQPSWAVSVNGSPSLVKFSGYTVR